MALKQAATAGAGAAQGTKQAWLQLLAQALHYGPWCRPEPRRDFFLSLAFAAQRGGSKMLREAGKRRRDRRAAGRYATGTRA